ncbi:MAG: DEAD/DEAH box helicase, partial [Deltaproteobacteria bacterium]|nr:DEAD/DEAH box helicase [Deltaproteobacteria bacterium]
MHPRFKKPHQQASAGPKPDPVRPIGAYLPERVYDPALPIIAKKEDIIQAISEHSVVIVSGETGSGKTTQLPKFCLDAGRGLSGIIGCTQPRRIAAMTVANRIAEEIGETIGQSVGYKIRFTDRTSRHSIIKVMTDGILLAETLNDPFLSRYDTLIVDEAHERSLNIDFILGIIKTLLQKRNDLKLIITSATIDTDKFSKAFDHAPVIEVSGRMYPVEVRYLPPNVSSDTDDEPTPVELAVKAVDRLCRQEPPGDVLVFMPTEQDIRETCELIAGRRLRHVTVLPLFARLSAKDQARV